MKTKIIYISGNEIFDMADIRAAFEEVRNALNLGPDTIMFGVPVDADDAISATTAPCQISTTPNTTDEDAAPIPTPEISIQDDAEPQIQAPAAPNPAAKRGRGRAKAKDSAPVAITEEPQTTDMPENLDAPDTSDAPVVPILSVLAAKVVEETKNPDIPDNTDNEDAVDAIEDTVADNAAPLVAETEIESECDTPEITDTLIATADLQQVKIEDMITDDAPIASAEKTLEQLLESMTPLREDYIDDEIPMDAAEDIAPTAFETPVDDGDGDATLEQLAAEFVETEDSIVSTPKAENHGKIGKLKNILPFKKAKRDDGGLMGDLFGWAGIAANDDEFSIPGFFTTAASKK